jgi:hypothetical protein
MNPDRFPTRCPKLLSSILRVGDLLVEVVEFGAAGKYPLGSVMDKDLWTVMTFIEHCR